MRRPMRAGKAWLGLTPKPAVRELPKKRMCFGVGDAEWDAGVARGEGDAGVTRGAEDAGDAGVTRGARRKRASQYNLWNVNISVSKLFQTVVTTILQI